MVWNGTEYAWNVWSRRFRAECIALIVEWVLWVGDGCLDSVSGCTVVYRAE